MRGRTAADFGLLPDAELHSPDSATGTRDRHGPGAGTDTRGFARYHNLKNRACGHVWQARFFSTPLDNAYLWRAMAYVERNPVRAGLVEQAEQYAWSSTRLRLPGAEKECRIDLSAWRLEYNWPRWKEALETSIDEEAFGRRLQEASRRGRPLGDEQFTVDLEKRCGRRIRPLPVGRPKKSAAEEKDQLAFGFGV